MSRFLYFDLPAVAAQAQHAVLADRNLLTESADGPTRAAEPALHLYRLGGFAWLAGNGVRPFPHPLPAAVKGNTSLTVPAVRLPHGSDPQSLPLLSNTGPQLMDLITQGLDDGAPLVLVDPHTLAVGVGRRRLRRTPR
ncbi:MULTISPECIES: hypothetical protein [unclassified Micromonospora]|uniref:hypothetical protein n=1 Tax=unclassified Micromonospora TaxID=2617518 RepID=UPI001C2467A9|nr:MULTISPECIES: hypothetical protein [unclassified Micromonospora]MBU8857743.1 hypothetical protein [Micromonospora sp. WMMB482]MDM4783370.1 hypothetical protein [Micromonospora sp. b486]